MITVQRDSDFNCVCEETEEKRLCTVDGLNSNIPLIIYLCVLDEDDGLGTGTFRIELSRSFPFDLNIEVISSMESVSDFSPYNYYEMNDNITLKQGETISDTYEFSFFSQSESYAYGYEGGYCTDRLFIQTINDIEGETYINIVDGAKYKVSRGIIGDSIVLTNGNTKYNIDIKRK